MLSDQQVKFGSIQLGDESRIKLFKIITQASKQRSFSQGFLGCVDYIGSNLPTYTDIVKRPVSLDMIKKSLLQLKHRLMYDFVRDVVQIHVNCTRFAQASGTTGIAEQADELLNYILVMLQQQFFTKLTNSQIFHLGITPSFRPQVLIQEIDVDETILLQQISSLSEAQRTVLKQAHRFDFKKMDCSQVFALQKAVTELIYE
ncbi:Bromodomain-containing protein [Spironucleus salmonicida]|uniref:Bromodomain-containing protein n=1 Tax=Spironucleus salmonicida TaxID=348837 RepID=V6LSF2_9EUKA|nr:Bromodomain-containing protein [Spironucleus salmonicida]|eukprot:EST43684.1 Bromodomain-containing protein [Spironucleus salmonicida]